ncbi:MAG: hypothetical protein REI11_21030 [Patulibacter sp.]|nr:hypothetical protein [Patulibacter sp.]
MPAPFEPAPIPGEGSWLGPVEVIALACTGIGWLLPGPGWLVGIVAVLISSRWTAGEKALAIIGPVVLIAIPFVGFMSTVFDPGLDGLSSALGWLVALFVVAVAVWPAAATYLWVKGRRRALGRPS